MISGGQQFAASTHGFDPSPPSRAEVEQWIQQAGTDGQDGRFDAAIAAYGKSLKSGQLSQGELAEIHGRRGNIYLAMANHDFALRDLDAAIAINAANPYYWLWRGNAYIAKLAPDRAIDDYGEAMRLLPRPPDAYANRAAAYMSVGKFDPALSDLDNVLQFAPDHALSRNNRCYLKAFALEDYAGALPDCDRAIALVDNFVLAYQNRAAIHERLRQFDLARRDYEKAAELAPALAAQRDAALTRMQRQQELMETPPDLIMN